MEGLKDLKAGEWHREMSPGRNLGCFPTFITVATSEIQMPGMYRSLIFIVCSLFSFIQLFAQRTIVGKVSDCKGEPLAGATIIIKGTDIGMLSDENGFYRIELSKKLDGRRQALIFKFFGTKTQQVFIKGRDTINVQLDYVPVQSGPFIYGNRLEKYVYVPPPEPSAPGVEPRRIVGRVTGLGKVALYRASIRVKGTDLRVMANRAGYYSIELPENLKQRKLTFIFSHSETKTKAVKIKDKYKNRVNVTLEYLLPYSIEDPCK